MPTIADHGGPEVAADVGLETLLTRALEEEVGLLDTLRNVFVAQREALGAGDPAALDDGVFAATRVLRTLEEARRRRRGIVTGLVGSEVDFEELDTVMTGSASRAVRLAQESVRRAAAGLRQEVALLRRILHVALADNRHYLEALLGEDRAGAPAGGYGPASGEPPAAGPGGVVLNRTA